MNLEEAIQAITDQVHKVAGVINSVQENDLVKVATEGSAFAGFVFTGANYLMQRKYESFLKGFNENEPPTQEQIDKLIKYIDSEPKAEFIADTLSRILLARSSKSCLVMGSIMNTMVKNQDNLKHQHLICIHALLDFFDMDLTNFKHIVEIIPRNKRKIGMNLYTSKLREICKQEDIEWASMLLTIDKSVNLQVLNKEMLMDVDVDVDEELGTTTSGDYEELFTINGTGFMLYDHIIKCRI